MDSRTLEAHVRQRLTLTPEFELVDVREYAGASTEQRHVSAVLLHGPSRLRLHFVLGGRVRLGLDDACRGDLAAQLEELDLEEGLELLDSVPHPQERVLGDFCITPSPLTLDQLGVLNGEEPSGDDSYVRLARREVDALTPGTLSLPSASELEFAALGGCQGAFFWGNDLPDAGRWNEDPSNPHADSTNQYGLTDVLAYREWCREAGALRVKGGAADLFPWQGAEGLLMLPSLTERPGPTEVGLVRLVFRWA